MPAANFAAAVTFGQCFPLDLSHEGSGSDPAADPADSPGCGNGHFLAGTAITLTASPEPGWGIYGWQGVDNGSPTLQVYLIMPAADHAIGVSYSLWLPFTPGAPGQRW